MTRKNIKVTEDVFEQHNEKRKARGLTWSEYLRRVAFEDDRKTEDSDGVSHPSSTDVSGELADIRTELTEIKSELRRFK